MAQPISFHPSPRLTTIAGEMIREAPVKHADAVLSALELLQLMHDKGVLNLLRGLVGAGDELTSIAAKAMDSDDVIRAIRNFILLSKLFAGIHPELLSKLAETVRETAERETSVKAPGVLELMWRMRSESSRHAAAIALDLVEAVGKGL